MSEKVRRGHWPTVAPIGYQNNLATHRIESDPEHAPIIAKLFEWYVREEKLVRQFGEILKDVRIPAEPAGKLATVLRESQSDKEKFVRRSMLRLQQQQMLLRSKLAFMRASLQAYKT